MNNDPQAACFSLFLVLVIFATLGAWCFDYDLKAIWGLDVAWYWDVIGGICTGGVAITAAIVLGIVHTQRDFPLTKPSKPALSDEVALVY